MKKSLATLFVLSLTILSFNLCYAMPYQGSMPNGAINPLTSTDAFTLQNTWVGTDPLNMGIRILSGTSTIIDTGYDADISDTAWSLYPGQWLAAQFTLSQDSTIDTINGWMWGQTDGSLRLAVYYSNGESYSTPIGTPIFTQAFNTSNDDGWYGPTGLNQSLVAGTYWAAFEVPSTPQVPEPTTMLLLGLGMAGLAIVRRKFKK